MRDKRVVTFESLHHIATITHRDDVSLREIRDMCLSGDIQGVSGIKRKQDYKTWRAKKEDIANDFEYIVGYVYGYYKEAFL